jgi:hypothetical protein
VILDTRTVLADLLRAACDDERVRVPPLAQGRVIDRMTELADIAGIVITREQ